MASRYSRRAQSKVKRAMHERKRGTLRSGGSGAKVTSRKQAIAIGLAEARREGAQVPKKAKTKTKTKTKTRSRARAKGGKRGASSAKRGGVKRAASR